MITRHFAGLRLILACGLALGMLVLPASSAVAAGHNGAHATGAKTHSKGKGKKHKKKKKSPPATVIVKCASVTVTCKGTPGPQGPAGANGTNGSSVVLRARSTGAVTIGPEKAPSGCKSFSCVEGANIPVNPSTWTEGPSEDDQMIGSATFVLPGAAECGVEEERENPTTKKMEKYFEPAEMFTIVSVGNVIQGFALAEGGETPRTVTTSLFGASFLVFELEALESEVGSGSFIGNGSSQTHTITVKAIDDCLNKHTTVNNVAIDVLASY